MFRIAKNAWHLVKNLIEGNDEISDKDKFAFLLGLLSIVHIINAFIFFFLGDISLSFYNIFSFLFYRFLKNLSVKKASYLLCFYMTYAEVFLCVILTTLVYGNSLNFNLYCFALVAAVFYMLSTTKSLSMKHSSALAFILASLSVGLYIYTQFSGNFVPELLTQFAAYSMGIRIFNVCVCFGGFVVFSLLYNWEMRNKTASLEKRNSQLVQFANKDSLTRLANRRSMSDHLNVAMHQLQRDNRVFSIILCDIDDFKKINDTYGHECGDKVLVNVANLITSQMRDTDFVCRWGGEEILMIVEGRIPTAIAIAERIRLNISSSEILHNGQKVRVTMTFGVAEANKSQRIEHIIQQADNNLYHGKATGKNKVVSEIPR